LPYHQRQFITAPDASNMADFLRISPWYAEMARTTLRANQVSWTLAQAEKWLRNRQPKTGSPKIIYGRAVTYHYINIDDSLGEKDKHTCHLDPVDWFHDHNESTPKRPRFKKAFCYLECTLRIGDIVVTVDLRLYLREKTVRRLTCTCASAGNRIFNRVLVHIIAPMVRFEEETYPLKYFGIPANQKGGNQ
jgi:hypothetical protein